MIIRIETTITLLPIIIAETLIVLLLIGIVILHLRQAVELQVVRVEVIIHREVVIFKEDNFK